MSNYYYRNKRKNGRPVKEYIGPKADPVVDIVSRFDSIAGAEKRAQREQRNKERCQYEKIEHQVVEHRLLVGRVTDLWIGSQLEAGVDKDWKWKNRRTVIIGGNKVPERIHKEDVEILVYKSEQGDEAALQTLRKLIANDRELFEEIGNLYCHCLENYISLLTRGNLVGREAVLAKINDLKAKLSVREQSAVIDLIIEQIVLNRLDVAYVQLQLAQPQHNKADSNFLERRLKKSQNRYLKALEALERVKQLSDR